MTATERSGSGTSRRKAHRPKAATGTAARTRSTVQDGSVTAARTAAASAMTGTTRRNSSPRSAASPEAPATPRQYRRAPRRDIVPESEHDPQTASGLAAMKVVVVQRTGAHVSLHVHACLLSSTVRG